MLKTTLCLCGFGLIVAACGSAESSAESAVRQSLKDPDSAKFGKYTKVTDVRACLTVNAKNSMGGYTGDQVAYLVIREGKWYVAVIDAEFDHEHCIAIMSEREASKNATRK